MMETLHRAGRNAFRGSVVGLWIATGAGISLPIAPGAAPLPPSGAERDSLVSGILRERQRTAAWLERDVTSYLAAMRRVDFDRRASLTLGSAPGNDVRISDSSLAARHLRVTVIGDSFRVEALDPGARFVALQAERRLAMLPPSGIGVGRFHVRLSHQRFPALIVFDPRNPRLKEFKGLEYYPVDLAYRFVLPLRPDPTPDTILVLSTRGNRRRAVRAGWFEFRVGGRRCRLEATRLLEPGVGERDLAIFFKDATSGKETYPLGRYLDPEPAPQGRYVLDFNRAYNPACAFSDHYNCPIPSRANALAVPIRAGEKDSHYSTH
jgi:uncharacterized protein (DUF1684 family)